MRTNILNARLKESRLSSNKTLLDAANHIGVKEATMQRYESGKIKTINYDTICELAKFYNTTPQHLMGWDCDSNGEFHTKDENLKNLYQSLSQMDEDEITKVTEYAQFILEQRKK